MGIVGEVWSFDLPPIVGPVLMLHQQPGAVKQLGETLPGDFFCCPPLAQQHICFSEFPDDLFSWVSSLAGHCLSPFGLIRIIVRGSGFGGRSLSKLWHGWSQRFLLSIFWAFWLHSVTERRFCSVQFPSYYLCLVPWFRFQNQSHRSLQSPIADNC